MRTIDYFYSKRHIKNKLIGAIAVQKCTQKYTITNFKLNFKIPSGVFLQIRALPQLGQSMQRNQCVNIV